MTAAATVANGLPTLSSPAADAAPTYERQYDSRGNLVWEFANWLETVYRHDPACDRPVYRSQAGGYLGSGTPFAEDRWEYDASCRLVRHEDPAGIVTTRAYDPLTGLLAQESDPAGWRTRYQHDPLGRVTRIEQRDGSITELEYDPADRVVRETRTGADATREVVLRTYDPLGRPTFVQGPGDALVEYRYDGTGGGGCCGGHADGPVEVIDADGEVTRYEYDDEGRTVAVTDPTGARTTREYDPGGLPVRSTDAAARTTTFAYDWNRRLSAVTDPAAGTTAYAYPAYRSDSSVDTVTDAESRMSSWLWGSTGSTYRSVSEAHLPDSGTDRYAYDVAGRLQTQYRAAGPNIIHAVDGAGRVQSVRYEDRFHVRPDRVARYAYDTLGRISRVDDFSGRTDLTYDAADRVATDTRTQDGRAYATDYDYDGLGNLVELTYPSGMRVRFEREAADPAKLSRVVAVDGGTETLLADEITYTAAGLLTGYTAGNGLRYGFERGAGGRLERLTTGLPGDPTPDVLDLTYQYDATGNITAILDAVDPERTAYYRHDPLDRLVEADGWWGTLGWTYDRTGNRLSEARDGVVSTYAYQAGTSRLLAVTDAATGATEHALEYDASGQATRFDDLLLEYDAADRLFRVRDAATGATVQENGYDHAFRRTRRTSYRDAAGVPLPAPACTAFVYDATSRLIAEHDCSAGSPPAPSANVVAEYVYLEGYAVLAARRGGAWYGYASDHLPTPRKATDATGAVVWDGRHEPFGEVDEAVASIDQPLRFPGQYEDGGLGLTYNHHRWFVPGLGRYLAVDPAPCHGSSCRHEAYVYASGAPAVATDPSGRIVRFSGCPREFERCLARFRNCLHPSRDPNPSPTAGEQCGDCRGSYDRLRRLVDAYDKLVMVVCRQRWHQHTGAGTVGGETFCFDPSGLAITVEMYFGPAGRYDPADFCGTLLEELLHAEYTCGPKHETETEIRGRRMCMRELHPDCFR